MGVIRGYRVLLDPQVLGYALSTLSRIKRAPGQLERVKYLDQLLQSLVGMAGTHTSLIKAEYYTLPSLEQGREL